MEQHLIAHEPLETLDSALPPTDRREAIAFHMAALEELADPAARGDGWTPFARKLFLQTLAESGRVTLACEYACLSKQSAYALRARDPIFAAGWDAACELARMPLADALYEAALDGLTETITRDDGRTMTRHRFDSRLSIAVLNRLDRRCDRAAEQGSRHSGAVGRWDEFTAAVGADDADAARAILDPAQAAKLSQASQLSEEVEREPVVEHRVWFDEDTEQWRTDFPPPEGFDGDEDERLYEYSRTLTAEELVPVERFAEIDEAKERAAEAAERDAWFANLAASLEGGHDDDEDEGLSVPAKGTHQSSTLMGPKAGTQTADERSFDGAAPDSRLDEDAEIDRRIDEILDSGIFGT